MSPVPDPASDPALTALLDALPDADREAVRRLVRPVAVGAAPPVVVEPQRRGLLRRRSTAAAERPAPAVTDSYLGGHPFLPSGSAWPRDQQDRDLDFVAQVSFAEVPSPPGFPSAGMLQVFTVPEHGWLPGEPDVGSGTAGLHLCWVDGDRLAAEARSAPPSTAPAPRSEATPVETPGPHPLTFEATVQVPLGWENLQPDVDATPEAFAAIERLLEHECDDLPEPLGADGDVRVGGWPDFMQGAPDVPPGRAHTLLLELRSTGLLMWGDVGTAQIFGDPAELAAGGLDGVWWDWAC